MAPKKDQKFQDYFEWSSVPYKTLKFWFLTVLVIAGTGTGIYLYARYASRLAQIAQESLHKEEAVEHRPCRFAQIEGDVRVKRVNAVAWLPAREVKEMFPGDMVETGSNSSATIVFFNGDTVIIKPDSIASISQSSEDTITQRRSMAMELTSGTVDLATSQRNVPQSTSRLETPNAQAEFDPLTEAEARHDKKIKSSEFTVFKGGAQVNSRAGGAVRLKSMENIAVDANRKFGQTRTLLSPPSLVSPRNMESFTTTNPRGVAVLLTWKPLDNGREYLVRLAATSNLYPTRLSERTSKSSMVVKDLNYGIYFWQVTAFDELGIQGRPSQVYRFILASPKTVARPHEIRIHIDKLQPFGNIVEIVGKTEPGISLTVNEEIVEVKGDGSFTHFTTPIDQKGPVELSFIARDLSGTTKRLIRRVIIE
ncbi:MAG: FecR domain-containing protein [Acidobacteria bacterium]|nr:FecR domain-containing protein [Acidobacteriota bacterium]